MIMMIQVTLTENTQGLVKRSLLGTSCFGRVDNLGVL